VLKFQLDDADAQAGVEERARGGLARRPQTKPRAALEAKAAKSGAVAVGLSMLAQGCPDAGLLLHRPLFAPLRGWSPPCGAGLSHMNSTAAHPDESRGPS
jgi:hypothetical protein